MLDYLLCHMELHKQPEFKVEYKALKPLTRHILLLMWKETKAWTKWGRYIWQETDLRVRTELLNDKPSCNIGSSLQPKTLPSYDREDMVQPAIGALKSTISTWPQVKLWNWVGLSEWPLGLPLSFNLFPKPTIPSCVLHSPLNLSMLHGKYNGGRFKISPDIIPQSTYCKGLRANFPGCRQWVTPLLSWNKLQYFS